MGTRHLVAAVVDGEPRIAQYGQWDGYPGGVGLDVLSFIDNHDMFEFAKNLRLTHWVTEDEIRQMERSINPTTDIGAGWLTYADSQAFYRKFPQFSRDTSAQILELVYHLDVMALRNSWEFGADSLFCEWAYVLDMDRNVLEVYKGFNRTDSAEGRWAGAKAENSDGYGPVTKVAEFPFTSLPDTDTFIRTLDPDEEDD